ncbi:hypothetical protein [Pyruvatibacter sp.]|uniref:hypothetical protein n=1 Tax=Pyruvatibacter sp. TaxID=1981328 RepID=UPI0032663A09
MTDKKKPSSVLSLRLTRDERSRLEHAARRQTLSAYARSVLFGADATKPRLRARRSVPDEKLLAQILGKLGQSALAQSLATLAQAVRLGSLPVTPETESAIRKACDDIAAIKSMLMKALHIREH